MEQSILKSTKKMLQIGLDDASFDLDVITFINDAFSTLFDAGVGPTMGFMIEDDEAVWEDFLPIDPAQERSKIMQSRAKAFVQTHVRLRFDPPTTSFALTATKEQLDESLWRINVNREDTDWVDPRPATDLLVIDGNGPDDGF